MTAYFNPTKGIFVSKIVKSSLQLRFDELAALVLRLQNEKCEATTLMAHFVPGSLDRTLANLEAAGYWKPDNECSFEEREERRVYGKPWYILGKYMGDLERALKRVQKPAVALLKAEVYNPNQHRPLRDDPADIYGMSRHV